MLSTWDDLWEFWDFWKFFENFEFHKIRLLTTEAVSPEAVLNSEPSKNTSEQLFFLSTSKIKDGVKFKFADSQSHCNQLQSVAISNNQLNTHSRILKSRVIVISCNRLQSATTNWTHAFQNFEKYIILYTVSCIDPKNEVFEVWQVLRIA